MADAIRQFSVRNGQMLGLLGNTGNSSGPHLHFGLMDDPDPLAGESLPIACDRCTLRGNFLISNAAPPIGGSIVSLLAPEFPIAGSNRAP